MEAMFNFIPAPIALVLMLIGFAALRGALPDWLKPFITDEVLDSVIEKAVSMMKKALADKKPATT